MAVAVRLVIAPFFMHAGDMSTIHESSIMVLNGANLYDYVYTKTLQLQNATGLPVFFEGYAYHPLLIYFFVPFYWLFTLIAGPNPVMINGHYPSLPILIYPWAPVLLLMLKVPIILADATVVYLLSGMDLRKAKIYAFCPYVIFISAVWGMFDAFVAVFLLASYLVSSRSSVLSGFFYGLSLLKLYTIVLLPLYVVRLFGKWRALAGFTVGFALTLLPILYFWLENSRSIWYVLVTFPGTRLMGGVNLYNFIWVIPDLLYDLEMSAIPNFALVIGLLLVIPIFGRKAPLLESILAVMLTYFLLGKIVNEQYLVSILPLMLLCKECNHRIWVAPFVFLFLRSPFYYFALPILWTSPVFYSYYLQADAVWRQVQALGYLQIPMYAVGVAFSLAIFWNLLRVWEAGGAEARLWASRQESRIRRVIVEVGRAISRWLRPTVLSLVRSAFVASSRLRNTPSQR